MTVDFPAATATELTRALRQREVSSRELLAAMVTRIETHNPALGAVVALDAERAFIAAAHADNARARGAEPGPLEGLPMTVKDVWETAGLATTSGATELTGHVPNTDAVTVARLRAAGALIVGKTNTPRYAGDIQTYNEIHGRTNNPWALDRTAGGSSGGSAAAVAAGLTPLELGSDIGGSIRGPSHFCGVYGLKPSWGVIPSRGHIPGPPGSLVEVDVNSGGPLARSVADLALALDVLAGPNAELATAWRLELPEGDPVTSLRGLHVGVVYDDPRFPVASEVQRALGSLAARLGDAGAVVGDVSLPTPLMEGFAAWCELVLPILGLDLDPTAFDAFAAVAAQTDARTGGTIGLAARSLVSRYRDRHLADERRQRARRQWAKFFERWDVVVAPTMPTAAFTHDTTGDISARTLDVDGRAVPHLELTAWCGAVGSALLPVVDVPAGRTDDGLPVGAQLIGPSFEDRRLLRIAALVEEASGGFVPPPDFAP